MIITQEIKNLCRNDAQLRFRDMGCYAQTLLAAARPSGALQYLHFGEWLDTYTSNFAVNMDRVYRINPEFSVPITDKKETMKITAKELAECQNTDKRVCGDISQAMKNRLLTAAIDGRLEYLDTANTWRNYNSTILCPGIIYRIDPKTPVTEDKKPEFVDCPVKTIGGVIYYIRPWNSDHPLPVSGAPGYENFLWFVYTQGNGETATIQYLCPQLGTLKAVRFRNT